jgi:WD40 repeat protein
VHFDPSGKGVGRLGADGQWQTWGGTYARIKPIAKLELADGVRFLAFTPDQSQAIVGTLTATIHAWDLQLGKVTKAHCSEGIADGALSADGKTLATIGFSGDVALWSLQPLKVVATLKRREALKAGENEGTAIAVSADGTRLATGSWDGLITVWDVPNRKELLQLPKQELPVECLGFSPDGQRLVSTTGTWKDWKVPGAIRVWDVTSGKELATLPGPKGTIRTAAFSRDGKTLIAGGSQNELLRFVESEGGWQEQPAVSTAGDNAAAAFIGDGADTVFSATSFGTASVWTFQPRGRRECLSPLTATAKAVDAVAVTTDGSLLAMGTSGGEVLFFVTPGAAPSSSGFQLAKRNIPGRVAPYVAKP